MLEALASAVAGASDKEERLVTGALARSTAAPVSPLAALLASDKAPVDDRARAARVLGAIDDDARGGAAGRALGRGPFPCARAVVERARPHAPKLPSAAVLAAIAAGPHRRPRAGGRPAARSCPAAISAIRAARRGRSDRCARRSRPNDSFEVRGRAVMALGTLGSAGDPARWRSCASTATSPCCATWRRASSPADARRPAPAPRRLDVRPALRGALADPDPRVRETAALALGQHNDAESAPALIAGAKQEPWPFVRRAELEALGHLCTPGAGDLMLRAVARDVDEVRRAALVGLARCKDPRTRAVLLKTVARQNEAATVRELAAALIGESGDHGAAPAAGDRAAQPGQRGGRRSGAGGRHRDRAARPRPPGRPGRRRRGGDDGRRQAPSLPRGRDRSAEHAVRSVRRARDAARARDGPRGGARGGGAERREALRLAVTFGAPGAFGGQGLGPRLTCGSNASARSQVRRRTWLFPARSLRPDHKPSCAPEKASSGLRRSIESKRPRRAKRREGVMRASAARSDARV